MKHLHINDLLDIEFEMTKTKQFKTTVVFEPIFKNLMNNLKEKPIDRIIARNGRKQITILRNLKPLKWK